MKIQINNISLAYQDNAITKVQVYFTGADDDRSININGYIPLTAEEYDGKPFAELMELVQQKVLEKLGEIPAQ